MNTIFNLGYGLSPKGYWYGFPDTWETAELEKRIVTNLQKIEPCDLFVNAVWGFNDYEHPITGVVDNKFNITLDLVKNHSVKKILFYNFVDPMYDDSEWYSVLEECSRIIGIENIKVAGFINTDKFKQDISVQFWAIYQSEAFQKYNTDQLRSNPFEHLYLCYNRKPTSHRKSLYNSFEKNDILRQGIFTLGNEDPSKVKLINNKISFKNLDVHGNFNIPNDTVSLGPLEQWNKCFLVIVTETDNNSTTKVPFLSEKIWKPLIGMRPFLCLGDKGTIKLLNQAGFYTFNEFFGLNKDDLTVEDITNALKNYKGDMETDFKNLQDKLTHNRLRFFSYAQEQKNLVNL
jgi:hypothetical protein